MHELSLTQSIVDMAIDHARRERAVAIRSVTVEIGDLSGVMADAVEFAFDVCCRGTLAEGASLLIRKIPGRGHCHECLRESDLDTLSHVCPNCGKLALELIAGEEMRLTELEID